CCATEPAVTASPPGGMSRSISSAWPRSVSRFDIGLPSLFAIGRRDYRLSASYMRRTGTIDLQPLSPVLGAQAPGARLLDADDSTVEAVRSAVRESGLVFFRDQGLSPEGLLEVTCRFGEAERFSHERAY